MTAKTATPAKAPSEALLLEIAAKHFHVETLETRNSDGLDFHDVAVWSIRALVARKDSRAFSLVTVARRVVMV